MYRFLRPLLVACLWPLLVCSPFLSPLRLSGSSGVLAGRRLAETPAAALRMRLFLALPFSSPGFAPPFCSPGLAPPCSSSALVPSFSQGREQQGPCGYWPCHVFGTACFSKVATVTRMRATGALRILALPRFRNSVFLKSGNSHRKKRFRF